MAKNTSNEKLAFALTGLSVALIGLMVFREAREMFKEKDRQGHFKEGREK